MNLKLVEVQSTSVVGMTEIPTVPSSGLPAITRQQMEEVDRVMIEDLHISLAQMMENAGRNLAALAQKRFAAARVCVMAGSGGNGGGGLVAARHLSNWGVDVMVTLGQPVDSMARVPAHQLDALQQMKVAIGEEPVSADLYLDALIGYSLQGDPRGRKADLIEWLNQQEQPVLALDTPSGLDVTTGEPANPCVAATATMTLAAPKTGLFGAEQVGELYLADISVPPGVYAPFGTEMPTSVFAQSPVVRVA